jgi:hypothetical protein
MEMRRRNLGVIVSISRKLFVGPTTTVSTLALARPCMYLDHNDVW